MASSPYVIGQWVRAEKFYGRKALIDEILSGHRSFLWVVGTRRIGKTSMLKQLEHIVTQAPAHGYIPICWDLEGTEDSDELHAGFNEALLDAEEGFEAAGVKVSEVEADDLFASLALIRRRLRSEKRRLLLLCDEAEALINLDRVDPALLRKLRRAVQTHENIRTVLTSSIRLWALAEQKGDTSPFLHGFIPPLYIGRLTDDEAVSLVRQTLLPADDRPKIDAGVAERICDLCDNHPYLLQLVGERLHGSGDLEVAVEDVASDEMVRYFFSVDYEMLSEVERGVVQTVAQNTSSTSNSIQRSLAVDSVALSGSLKRLENLGYIRRDAKRRFVLVNSFFLRWLGDMPDSKSWSSLSAGDGSATQSIGEPASTLSNTFAKAIGDRYDLQRRIGRGATGVVFKAHDRLLKQDIAVKLLHDEYAGHDEALRRIRQEIVLARDLSHPNIVRMYDLGESQGRRYLTMQWIDGTTLREHLSRVRQMPIGRMLTIATKLTSALEAAHARNILHRDIKPENILLDAQDEPYLLDFGLARLLGDPGMTRIGMFLGTPNYASPEQARMLPLDQRSDIYSLGLVFYEMVTGQRLFRGKNRDEVLQNRPHFRPPDPRDVCGDVPVELAALILRCLEQDPERRYAGAADLLGALKACEATLEDKT